MFQNIGLLILSFISIKNLHQDFPKRKGYIGATCIILAHVGLQKNPPNIRGQKKLHYCPGLLYKGDALVAMCAVWCVVAFLTHRTATKD